MDFSAPVAMVEDPDPKCHVMPAAIAARLARRPSGKGLATAGYIRDGMCVQNRGVSPQAPPEACRETPRLPNRHGKPVESARVRRLCQINCRHLAEMVIWRADDGGLAVETIVTGTAFSAVRCSSGRK